MKKIIVLLSAFTITAIVSCENEHEISASQVPQPVMNAFQTKYPNITPDKWVQEKEKLFMKQNLKAIIKMSKQSSMKTEILLKKNKT